LALSGLLKMALVSGPIKHEIIKLYGWASRFNPGAQHILRLNLLKFKGLKTSRIDQKMNLNPL